MEAAMKSLPRRLLTSTIGAFLALGMGSLKAWQDPIEPPADRRPPQVLPPPAGAISRQAVDERALRATVEELVACGTRNSLSSWNNPQRGIGCARDRIVARLKSIAQASGGQLEVVIDRFEAKSNRTANQPVPLENVYAILPGADENLKKRVFVVSGHYDSRASDVMDTQSEAPGADDNASGTAVSLECARLLAPGRYRSTLVFAAVSGEEQGLLGGERLLGYLRQNGYTIAGMLDNDIVGADFTPNSPHRIRVFSSGEGSDCDTPSRELARTVEEIEGQERIRLVFRVDRLGRGGDHMPFIEAGLAAVRFTEPLEDYNHEHQTPRVENGIEYGDLMKFLNLRFIGDVARANAEALRELALGPAPAEDVRLSGAVSPDAKISWRALEDAERAGFEILWRETTNPRWTVCDFARSPGEVVLKRVSTDNHFFAVRAVGKNGARSIPVPASERARGSTIQTALEPVRR
jgi:hypothetical protein